MTEYNKHKTAYWRGGWYLLGRGKTKAPFWNIFPGIKYLLPLASDADVNRITPERRELLLDAIDDGYSVEAWVKMLYSIREEIDGYFGKRWGE